MGIFGNKKDESRQADIELAAAIKRGDPEALEIFYNTYFNKLYKYVYYRVGQDHQHTEDVVHDTFMAAINKIDQFSPERGNLEAWLIMTSRNQISARKDQIDRTRANEFSWGALDRELDAIFAAIDTGDGPVKALENKELSDLIGATMGSLPDDYSSILEMKYIANLPVREIARILKRTEKSIESQLGRARQAFREVLTALADKGGRAACN